MLEYNEAKIISRKIAKENKIKTSKEWKQYCSNNKIILPANPREYYNDFISWMDWLGTDKKRNILIHDNFYIRIPFPLLDSLQDYKNGVELYKLYYGEQ